MFSYSLNSKLLTTHSCFTFGFAFWPLVRSYLHLVAAEKKKDATLKLGVFGGGCARSSDLSHGVLEGSFTGLTARHHEGQESGKIGILFLFLNL